uniref:HAUS augmin-like complex subunit 6 n=1 Tax=Dermatophagoides pteronyssinus TaxID=6956 RepID=A0A6P6YGM1_DERPT|nr:HAUS augmin-like complex subunit 6 [Dermatophagoides pteronyssinus]
MDKESIKRQHIVNILKNLNFESFLKKYSPKTVITSQSFDKLTTLQFNLFCYFLFFRINPESCHLRFRGVFPSRDVQQESEFRRLAIETINDFADRNQERLIKLKKIPAIHYQRLSGIVFVEQMFNLALFALFKYTSKQKFQSATKELNEFNDSIDKREEFVRQQSIDEYQNELKQSEEQICLFIKDYQEKITELNSKLSNLHEYGCSLNELKIINENLSIKLSKINDNLQKMLLHWNEILSSNESIRSLTNNQDQSNLINLSTTFIWNLSESMKEYEKFVRIDKSNATKWLQTFEHFSQLNETVRKIETKLQEISKKFEKIEQEKMEILSNDLVKQIGNHIENYVENLLNLNFQLKIDY